MTTTELVKFLKRYAMDHYNSGWSFIVECWEDAEILERFEEESVTTPNEAIAAFALDVELYEERMADVGNWR